MNKRAILKALSLAALALACGTAWGQSLQLQVESREIYAELPFTLSLSARGFDEEPQPDPPALEIEGCRTTFLGVTPNVSSAVQIVNGRRSEWREVTFVYRWRVEAPAAGDYTVPPLTVTQGDKSASSRAATFAARGIETTTDMIVRMDLPDRPVWIGETFDVAIEWLLRKDVGDHELVVPLFDQEGVQVESTAGGRQRTLPFTAGAGKVELAVVQDQVTEGGTAYTRFRFPARVTVSRAGPLELEPVRVAASLQTGTRRDNFGFRVPAYELFKAEGERRRLVVRPLPLEGRPPSFENAIGSAFSIDVQASRTVVQVGDPVELSIRVRGDGPLEGLSLPQLDGPGGLPAGLFSVPDTALTGVIDEEENAKTFDVTVRIRSAEAREIPPLSFSYFDPVRGEYATVRSQPIALSVAGSNLVDAADVMAAPAVSAVSPESAGAADGGSQSLASLIGADMSLSAPRATLHRALLPDDLGMALALLYAIPVLVFGGRIWLTRTQASRGRRRELHKALREMEKALRSGGPARESAPLAVNAWRALARRTGRQGAMRTVLVERLENCAFDPDVADQPIEAGLADEVLALARRWVKEAQDGTSKAAGAALGAALLLALGPGVPVPAAYAQDTPGGTLDQARELYQAALQEDDRVQRTRLFSDAERLFRGLGLQHPGSPELLADWGNAALGARDLGRAVLAYRRALEVDPTHARAQTNLEWLRARAPVWLPRPGSRSALDSLFFWHHNLSVAQRHLIGAVAFGLAVLLLAPWPHRRARPLRKLAAPLLVVWIAATGSALLATDGSAAAVVLNDGTVLRSADSLGAPPSLGNPLPAGTELALLESREGWERVVLADGTRGWVASSSIEAVSP